MYLFTRCTRHDLVIDAGCRTMRRDPARAKARFAQEPTLMTRLKPCPFKSPLVRDHSFDLLLVSFVQNRIAIELALALGALRSQDVALESVSALNPATRRLLKALGSAAVRLHLNLRHKSPCRRLKAAAAISMKTQESRFRQVQGLWRATFSMEV